MYQSIYFVSEHTISKDLGALRVKVEYIEYIEYNIEHHLHHSRFTTTKFEHYINHGFQLSNTLYLTHIIPSITEHLSISTIEHNHACSIFNCIATSPSNIIYLTSHTPYYTMLIIHLHIDHASAAKTTIYKTNCDYNNRQKSPAETIPSSHFETCILLPFLQRESGSPFRQQPMHPRAHRFGLPDSIATSIHFFQ